MVISGRDRRVLRAGPGGVPVGANGERARGLGGVPCGLAGTLGVFGGGGAEGLLGGGGGAELAAGRPGRGVGTCAATGRALGAGGGAARSSSG
jgi:hypothetical protein